MKFTAILKSHKGILTRRKNSLKLLNLVKTKLENEPFFKEQSLTLFCAGSLARLETGDKSDLELFVTANNDKRLSSRLFEVTLFAHLIRINQELNFPPFSNDGEFLKIHLLDDLTKRTGSRTDDIENLFTVRMLLMLESYPLINEELYRQHLQSIIENYFRDGKGRSSFRPLFLLNDILRYWRTLCLNYEERRHEPERPWRKKNINLKFSRMITVFGTVLPLVAVPTANVTKVVDFCKLTPLERFAVGLDFLNDNKFLEEWEEILNIYEEFLTWKEKADMEEFMKIPENKKEVTDKANKFSKYLYKSLYHQKISEEYRRYLVL